MTTKYGIMEIETGKFMGRYKLSEFSEGTLSMEASKRLETEDLSYIARFFSAQPNARGEYDHHWDTQGHDPAEFVPVAFIREPGAQTTTVKQVELPDFIQCQNLSDRPLEKTPEIVFKHYFPEDIVETLNGENIEIFILATNDDAPVKEGTFVRVKGIEGTIAKVTHVAASTGDWPRVRDKDEKGAYLAVVDKDVQTLVNAAQLTDLEAPAACLRR
jgi:hypothetical protein